MTKKMTKVLATLACAMLLLGLLAVAPWTASAAVSDNLFVNGDFSDGMTNWFDRGTGEVGTGVTDGVLYVGNAGAGDYTNHVNNQPILTEKGATYTLSFKIKGDKEDTIMFAVKNSSNADGANAGGSDLYGGDWRGISTNWQTIEVDFTVPQDANRDYMHVMFVPVNTGFYLDDVTLVKQIPDHGYISNGDFETGDTAGWTVPGWCASSVSVTADAAKSGNYGLLIKDTGWANVQRVVTVNPNTTYKVSVDYKGYLAIYFKTADGSTQLQVEWCGQVDDWFTYECQFKTPANMTQLYLEFGCGSSSYLAMDNITMSEVVAEFSGLKNGDFETGDMSGWSGTNGTTASAEAAKDGSYGACLAGGQWDGMYQWIDVKKNTVYKFSFEYMCVDVSEYGSMYIKGNSTSNDHLIKDVWFKDEVGVWSFDGGTFNTGDYDRIYFQICKGNGKKYIDNIVLVEEGSAQDITDKIFNGDFELGTNQGWTVAGRNGVTDEEAHSGQYSMKIAGPADWTKTLQKIKVEPHADYLVTFWAKCMGGSASLFKVADANNRTVGATEEWFYGAYESWRSFSIPFNAGDNTEVAIQFEYAGGALMYVDDVRVQRYQVTNDLEILTNAGFESGWLEGYGLAGGGEVTDTIAHEGDYALALNGSINKGRVWKKITVQPETDYHLTFWANVSGATASTVAIMDLTNAFSILERTLPSTDGWEQVDVVFNTGENDVIYVSFNHAAGGAIAYIDDLNFVPYDVTGKAVILDMYLENADKLVAGENLVPLPNRNQTIQYNGEEALVESFNIPVEKDAVYVMTARVKGNLRSATNKGDVTFGIADPTDGSYLFYVKNTMSTRKYQFSAPAWDGEWHTVSMIFQTGPLTEVACQVNVTSADLELADITICPMDKIDYDMPETLKVTNDDPAILTPAAGKNLVGADEAFWLNGLGYGRHVTFADGALKIKSAYELPTGMHYIKTFDVEPNTEYILAFEFNGASQMGLIDATGAKLTMDLIDNGTEWWETGFGFNTGDSASISLYVVDIASNEAGLKNLRLFKAEDAYVAPALNGWVKEDGKWAYYENDVKVTNKWVKDSAGWCYLGADGYAVTNTWKKDSKGWCYLNGSGSMTKNAWVKTDGKWYFLDANGYMVTNAWKKDSKGWVYVGKDGAMLTNAWCKDSQGWCYVGADGYAVTNCWKKDSKGWIWLNASGSMTKNAWIKDNGKWYFLNKEGYMVTNAWMKDSKGWVYVGSDGAMLTNAWCKDSKGWCFVGKDGYAVTNCWKKDSKGWIWLDKNGSMTKSAWIEDGGKWYYLDANGYMVAGKTITISGKKYTFNAKGEWVEK